MDRDKKPIKPPVICCQSVAELDEAPGAVKKRCARCGEPIWVMPENAALRMPLICLTCAWQMIAEDPDPIIADASVARRMAAERN